MRKTKVHKINIEEAIRHTKVLKKASIHTDNFMLNHSSLTTLNILKKLGFTHVSVKDYS
jgi:hypothetical protein